MNLTKAEYVAKLTALKQEAMAFEEAHRKKETLGITIINIGNRIDPLSNSHKPLLGPLGIPSPAEKGIGTYE